MTAANETELVDDLQTWLRDYYHEDILELAQKYPNEQRWLTIEWGDLYQFDPEFADDFLNLPEEATKYIEDALYQYDLPIKVTLEDVDIRVVGLNDGDIYAPLEITRDAPEGYVGVKGDLHKVTTPTQELQTAVFDCQNPAGCTHSVEIEQFGEETQEPHKCDACGAQNCFTFNKRESEFEHYSKIRIQTPPDQSGEMQTDCIDGVVRGDLVWHGHDEVGLVGRSGDPVKVYGTIEYKQKDGRDVNERLYDEYLDVKAIEFDDEKDEIDIPKYRDEFEELAASEDPVELWKESLVPELHATPEWDTALELLVSYLFGSPRIDIPGGPTYRGDIHALIISDYGMGKSMVNSAVAMFSPKAIKESVTGMSSDVALLAAAVEDDFGEGQWTLQPGILVRGNGGHVILDEIDKTDADLERMNDALEGEQVVDVNKAGQSATYKSRVGLLATGNPEDSRFNKHDPISEQLDLDQSLLSRFDGIVTMQDDPDEEQDAHVAETAGMSYVEAFEYQHGDRDELDNLERAIEPDVGMNWIAYARENVHPQPKREHIEQIRDWYAEDVRQLNKKFNENKEEGAEMPVPVNARLIPATIRRAVAFARVHLRDEVHQSDVERAMDLSKALVGQQFDGDKFVPQEARKTSKPDSQKDEYEEVRDVIEHMSGDDGAHIDEVMTEAAKRGMDRGDVEHKIKKLKHKGEVYEPATDVLRTT